MLYIVGTPIGNLKDLSLRAIEVLKSVDEIACEDTRHSITLLNAYEIKKPLVAYHKFNEKESALKIVEKLKNGTNIALISDAGMPLISDPGEVLVKTLIENNLEFTVIPGACAFVSALILSGLDSSRFAFLGFLPQKKSQRVELLEKYKNLDLTLIFYCAPHDITKDISDIYSVFGDRVAVAVKEITKIHESSIRFNLKDNLPQEPKGEFVLLVDKAQQQMPYSHLSPEELVYKYIQDGLEKKEALKKVAKERGIAKSDLYKLTLGDSSNK